MKKLSKRLSCLLASKRVWSLVSAGIILGSVPVFADINTNSVVQDEKLKSVILTERLMNTVPKSTSVNVEINDTEMNFQSEPYIVNDRTFVPVRELANALAVQEIQWDKEREVVTLIDGDKSIELFVNTNIVKLNNKTIHIEAPISIYNERSYIPLRMVAEAFECDVDWDQLSSTVVITTNNYDKADGEAYKKPVSIESKNISTVNYSQEDLYWLSRLVQAEASGEPFEGKLGVANVIVNRKKSSEFPNSIKGAIFDTKYGVQFTPTANGMIYKSPSNESIKAARMALEGTNNVGSSLYFVNPRKATNTWIMENRNKYMTIALHDFYI